MYKTGKEREGKGMELKKYLQKLPGQLLQVFGNAV